MNIYYYLAILFGALTALMGYLGQKREGDKQSSQVRELLDETQGLIAEAKSAGAQVPAQDVESLEDRYAALAQKFQTDRPLISAQISARKASRQAEQVTASAVLLQPVHAFTVEATKIAKAFSTDSTRWRVQFHTLPDNIVTAGSTHFMTYGIEGENISYVGTILVHRDDLTVSFTRTTAALDYWLNEHGIPAALAGAQWDSVKVDTWRSKMEVRCDENMVDVCDLVLTSDEYKELAGPDGTIGAELFGKVLEVVFLNTIRHELAVMRPPQANP